MLNYSDKKVPRNHRYQPGGVGHSIYVKLVKPLSVLGCLRVFAADIFKIKLDGLILFLNRTVVITLLKSSYMGSRFPYRHVMFPGGRFEKICSP